VHEPGREFMSICIFGRCVSIPLLPLPRAEAARCTSAVCFGAISRPADLLIQVRSPGSVSPFHLRQPDHPVRADPGRFPDISQSVSQQDVETVTTGLRRAGPNLAFRRATPSSRSVFPSGVPPYFLTKSSIKALKYVVSQEKPGCRGEQPSRTQVIDPDTERGK